ncbi:MULTISPECIES: tautomerase family protein [Corynebacterium]|uniref:4-oxalocrotonate tautomerase n=1 Tax=Corynebacterium flavescens TaxID=28028 RepID=A0A1L7CNX8_CORFL|nr:MULTISPECIES: tautomerase family protein [Corynebacterium]APT87556.1 4-oxalocrotonate tautomerase [Corynebacterium flavescens]KAA8719945.1 tautomerase family protein [Corynebacterium flavescens]GEB98413.1 tautomerase family protein [Corynebacterium flavescens]
MPLVRVDVPESTTAAHKDAIADGIYAALHSVFGAPNGDKFIIINSHDPANLYIDPHYFVDRSERAIIIQITLNAGRSVELKKEFYRTVADGLQAAIGIRTEDVFINLVEVPKENWSFGGGIAQYAD